MVGLICEKSVKRGIDKKKVMCYELVSRLDLW